MKIERRPDGTTVIKHFPVFITAIISAFPFIIFKTLVAPLLERPPRYDNLHVGIIAVLFVVTFAHFMWERVRFEFDPRRRIIRWKRHRLFTGVKSGQIAFDDVTDAILEAPPKVGGRNKLTRVTLVLKERRLPLMEVYGAGTKETQRTICEIIGLDGAAKSV